MAFLPPCSASPFASRDPPRVLSADASTPHMLMCDITHSHIKRNSFLAMLTALDPTPFLAHYAGVPCLIRGVEGYGDDAKIVISPCLNFYSRLGNARVANNKVKFCYGSEQRTADRADCYEFGVVRTKIQHIAEVKKLQPAVFPLVLTRDHNDDCPVCLEKLTGACVECSNKHQVCLPCHELTPIKNGVRTCPVCRTGDYSAAELEKVDAMKGRVTSKIEYLSVSAEGGNSFKMYRNSEALFLGMLRYMTQHGTFTPLQKMVASSFFNFYITHPDAFSTYDFNIMAQYNGNDRRINGAEDLGEAWNAYLAVIESPAIYNDVSYTEIFPYSYTESQFYNDVESITGSLSIIKQYTDHRAIILKRQIFFRAGIKAIPENERHKFIWGMIETLAKNLKGDKFLCDQKTLDVS